VTYYNDALGTQNTWVPDAIQQLADNIAHKHVSTTALFLSFLLLIMGVLLSAMVINSAVRGGMMAISRQPLTKSLIQRKVLQAFGMAVLVMIGVAAGALIVLHVL
jgi:hypothetical protein